MASNLDRLNAIKQMYLDLLLQVQLNLSNPTPANIAAAVALVNSASDTNPRIPKPMYSRDGSQVDWTAYQQTLVDMLDKINALIQAESPFAVNIRAVT